MSYPETNLNKWDYVFACTQEQINYGLRDLYNNDDLPGDFSIKSTLFFQNCELKGTFGMPTVEAIEHGLKLCKITLPLVDAELIIGEHTVKITEGAAMAVKTSLTSIELDVQTQESEMRGVYVNFKDENAVYDFKVDGLQGDEVAIIESLMRKQLQTLNGNSYLITVFEVGDDIFKWMPKLVRFTFNYNQEDPNLSPFIVCSSISGEEPEVENSLVFDSKILPEGLPACVWLSQQFLVGEVLTSSMNNALGNGSDFKYDGESGISLVETIEDIDPDGDRTVNLVDFTLGADKHAFKIYNKVKIPNITFMEITGVGKGWSEIDVELTENKTAIKIKTEVLKTESDTEDVPWWAVAIGFVLGIIGAIVTAIVIAIIEGIVKGEVGSQHSDGLEDALDLAVKGINKTTAQIPALQDSIVDGHVVFDGVTLENNGSLCLGISDVETKKALRSKREEELNTINVDNLEKHGLELSAEAKAMFAEMEA
jgi:hypothetical protein